MYIKYTTVLRYQAVSFSAEASTKGQKPSSNDQEDRWKALCGDNTYLTSLYVINSAMVKLSKMSKVGKVYCSLSGAVKCDERFFEAKSLNGTPQDVWEAARCPLSPRHATRRRC